jgi:outer membrane protein assembly factor BamD
LGWPNDDEWCSEGAVSRQPDVDMGADMDQVKFGQIGMSVSRDGFLRAGRLSRAMIVGLVVVLAGCSSKSGSTTNEFVDNTEPADKLYNEALANIDAGDSGEAIKKFKAVDKQHPYSSFARKSLLMTTYLSYKRGAYPEAINSGKRFVSLHPGDSDAAYAQYIVGMSYFRQIPEITRDQVTTKKAMRAMNVVVERYPDSEYVEDAKTKIRFTRDQLAGKDMQIGRYYQERNEHLAAINRFKKVVTNYSNTRHIEESLARLTESYFALGLTSEAQTAAAVLGHNFPDSKWYQDSYKLLQKGGLEPRENRGSWISRVGKKLITG